jgi:hypothetical protein
VAGHWAIRPLNASTPAAANPARSLPLVSETTTPTTVAPKPWEMSKNTEKVPTAWLRSSSGAAAITAVNSDGYSSDMPAPIPTAASQIEATDPQAATDRMPTVTPQSASVEPFRHPSRSGSRAPTMRTTSTSPAYRPNTPPTLSSPMSSA